VLHAFESGTPPPAIVQDETQVTHAPKLFAADMQIDWRLPAQEICHRIRALSPDPGAQTLLGPSRFKILDADVEPQNGVLAAGELGRGSTESLLVGTGLGALRLKIVQPEGKRAMTVAEWLRGRPPLPLKLGE
jgi:methionyl-tRNA formyltransferase